MAKIRVTIWNEFIHEHTNEAAKKMYPDGIHAAIGKGVANDDFDIKYAWLEKDEQHGLSEEVLNDTDVLIWWGHCAHDKVKDEVAARVMEHVWNGMGLICLHSAHMSKVFRHLNGTSGKLIWREANERERIWCANPGHPIAKGLPESFVLDYEEMYGEPFMIPQPDELVFAGWFRHGNLFRSGCCFYRGLGKVFYFQPGHESCRSYFNPNVQQILRNAIKWAKPGDFSQCRFPSSCDYVKKIIE